MGTYESKIPHLNVAQVWTAIQTFGSGLLKLANPANTFNYIFKGGAIVADRNVTMPLLTGDDVLVTQDMIQTLTNKTLTAPTIADLTNANHAHAVGAGGGGALTPTTIAATDTTDSTSPTTGALKTAGGLGVAKAIYAGGNIFVPAASKQIAVINPTNTGVLSVGGMQTGASMLDNQSFTITLENGCAQVLVQDSDGKGAVFFLEYASATITEISDPSNLWSVTDVDGNPGWAIFKAANSYTFTLKNYMNATKTLYVLVIGWVSSATAPA